MTGGQYGGPGGQRLYGDGREVEPITGRPTSHKGDPQVKAEPLTEKEESGIRLGAEVHHSEEPRWADEVVQGLIATIDRDRATAAKEIAELRARLVACSSTGGEIVKRLDENAKLRGLLARCQGKIDRGLFAELADSIDAALSRDTTEMTNA